MTSGNTRTAGYRARRPRRVAGATAASAVVVALLATACTAPPTVQNPSRVLQSVEASLSTDGSVTGLASTAVYVDDVAGASSSSQTSFEPKDVVDALPVRVTTRYRTADGSGTDLADLAGRTGRLEITLTVENLTVAPRELVYDAAGQSRTAPALVGAPFSVAASTVLEGVAPSRVVTETTDQGRGTNGIVSATPEGDAVVQWGALLAPPRSGASTTLQLVVDAHDFVPPRFDIAAQPGLSTDLSVDGVLASAFTTGPTSELALQQRTIELVGDVNEVLTRAGQTITEVRANLDTTSQTLGANAARRLSQSSGSLAGTMQELDRQLAALRSDLESTATETRSTVLEQMREAVTSVDDMLGDTSAEAPRIELSGTGCAAEAQAPLAPSDVYSSLLLVSAQLDGYARANARCQREVVAALEAMVGPETPDEAQCVQPSMTCALYRSSFAISTALIALVTSGEQLVEELQPEIVDPAIASYGDVSEGVDAVVGQLATLSSEVTEGSPDGGALQALRASVDALRTDLTGLAAHTDALRGKATEQVEAIGADDEPGTTLRGQNAALAEEVCALVARREGGRGLTPEQADRLVGSYLTGETCPAPPAPEPSAPQGDETGGAEAEPAEDAPSPWWFRKRTAGAEATPAPSEAPSDDPSAPSTSPSAAPSATPTRPAPDQPMSARLAAQAQAWDELRALADETGAAVTATLERVDALGGSLDGTTGTVTELQALAEGLRESADGLQRRLDALRSQQKQLVDRLEATVDAADRASIELPAQIDDYRTAVSAQGDADVTRVQAAFERSVAGLRSTRDDVAQDARSTIEGQRETLREHGEQLTAALHEQTVASLEQIAESTSASTRDLQGATALLVADLSRVMLDLGDRQVNGSGLLGSMSTSAAKAGSADVQLALASQNAAGYANIRGQDVAGLMLRQAQFEASLDAAASMPPFQLEVPAGATTQTFYSFRLGGGR
ncbi:hypothetical protein DNL40_06310 [Xylanimonas oleitrophica]|uniref:Uncharacterized protein n=1 Tax=Xylanimonas oleitrophica TaxID=2607479 RepID=A0A2W5WSW7_9MICO|nr:hypothetical protein [Xylanimonas oleitrophica]PZR53733.1 hypothetical protein DNL40_06310 [Xylanimonas oleitrophica]